MMDSLEKIAADVRVCRRCPLWQQRTHAVPGEGPANARILLIGEGPGLVEDQQGRPFVGASGRYLEERLAEIHLNRRDVFITNAVKCRPPENRDPEPAELVACRDYLDRQITLIQPRITVTLGRFSMSRYFPGQAISHIHGQTKRVADAVYLPMFHPAAALRNPEWHKAMLNDFKRLAELLAQLGPPSQSTTTADAGEHDTDGYEQLSLF